MILAQWLLVEFDDALSEWSSARGGTFDPVQWHARIGYTLLGMLIFRIFWGFVGTRTARFAQFARSPRAAIAYLKKLRNGTTEPQMGHNPAGGLMVIAMLATLLLQTITGLFAFNDVDFTGPLNSLISEKTADIIMDIHEINFNIILGLIGLHIAAILYYKMVQKQDLVGPMLRGYSNDNISGKETDQNSAVPKTYFLIGMIIAIVIVYFLTKGYW